MKKIKLLILIALLLYGFIVVDAEPEFNEQIIVTTDKGIKEVNSELNSQDLYFFEELAKQHNTIFYRYKSVNYFFYTKSVDTRDTSYDFELDCFDNKKKSGFSERYAKFNKQKMLAPKDSTFAFYYLSKDEKPTRAKENEAIKKAKTKYAHRYALIYYIDVSNRIPDIKIRFELPNSDIDITEIKHYLAICKLSDF